MRPLRYLPLLLALCALPAPALAGHTITQSSFHMRPGTTAEFSVVPTEPGCIADVITVTSQNPDVVCVFAVDDSGHTVGPGDGTTATVNNVESHDFVLIAKDVGALTFVSVSICWTETGAPPCDQDLCGSPPAFSVQVAPDPQTIGANLQQALDSDPVAMRTGEFFITPLVLLPPSGPWDMQFAIRWASRVRIDNNVSSRIGLGWSHNYDWLLAFPDFSGNMIEIYAPEGRVIRFRKSKFQPGWILEPYRDVPYELVEIGSDFVLVDPRTGYRYTFVPGAFDGKLASIENGRGGMLSMTYDANGRLETVTDNLGRTQTYTYVTNRLATVTRGTRTVTLAYDGARLDTVTDPDGAVTAFTYDLANPGNPQVAAVMRPEGNVPYAQAFDPKLRVTTQTDAYGNLFSFTYDDTGGVSTMTNPLAETRTVTHFGLELAQRVDEFGQTATASSDSTGRRDGLVDRLGGTTTYTHHAENGLPEMIQHADGGVSTFNWVGRAQGAALVHDLDSATRPDGGTESFTYDSLGNRTGWTDAGGNTWTYAYDSIGELTSIGHPGGGTTTIARNGDATPASVTDPAGNTTTYAYDAFSRRSQTTRPDAATVMYAYDALDRLTARTDEAGQTTALTYDANGNRTSVTTPLGNTTTFGYDAMDRLASRVDALGGTRTFAYDSAGRMRRTSDANGHTVNIARDLAGRPTGVTDGEGNVWSKTYDLEGAVASTTTPLGRTTTYTYDAMGRMTQRTSPLGHTASIGYDGMGRPVSTTDGIGRTTTWMRDLRGFVTGVDAGGGALTASYVHDALGRPTQITDARGKVWQNMYDTSGRRTARMDPLGRTTTSTYDSRNRLAMSTLPGGMGTVTYAYDAVGRLTQRTYSDATTITYGYDADGRMTSASGLTRAYDAAGRITSTNGITVGRDPGGRITSVTLAPGKAVTYAYDARNLVTAVSDWVGGTTTFAYDDDGRLTSLARPNGVTTAYGWDDDGRLASITHGTHGSITLARDAAAQIVSAARDLPQVATPPGSMQTRAYDDANQVSGRPHDDLGRPGGDGSRTFTWDLAGRATSIDHGAGAVTFDYDALDRMTARTESGVTREYVWNDAFAQPAISVVRETGADLRYDVHDPMGRLLHSIDAADDSRRFHHEDEMGNVVFLTDDVGAVTDTYAYDPWGVLLASSGTSDNRFTFGGLCGAMREGGLYRTGVRLYDPLEARFVTPDPVEGIDPRRINPYQALFGNPLLFVDPTGTDGLFFGCRFGTGQITWREAAAHAERSRAQIERLEEEYERLAAAEREREAPPAPAAPPAPDLDLAALIVDYIARHSPTVLANSIGSGLQSGAPGQLPTPAPLPEPRPSRGTTVGTTDYIETDTDDLLRYEPYSRTRQDLAVLDRIHGSGSDGRYGVDRVLDDHRIRGARAGLRALFEWNSPANLTEFHRRYRPREDWHQILFRMPHEID